MFADLDYDIEEDKLGIPTVPGKVTLQKDAQNLIGISIGGGAQYCPCLYIVQVFDNTPAALDGTVAAGDEITGVNGRSIKGKTKVEVAKMIQEVKLLSTHCAAAREPFASTPDSLHGGEVTIHYNKLQADPKQGMSLDIVLKKVKHRLVENMSSGTADALGLSRAILCNDGLVKRLEELERTAELYKGMTEHTKNLLRAFYELSQTHRAFGDVFSVIGVREPQPAASEAFVKFADAHRSIEKFGIRLLKTIKPMLTDLNTYLNKAIPDTRLTIKKYLDVKFEYLSYCLKVKEMDDEEYSCIALGEPLYRVSTGNYEYRLILRCRQEARARFSQMRKDVLEKMELLDQKHVQDIVFQLQRFVSTMSKYYNDCYSVLRDADVFPIEVDLAHTTLAYGFSQDEFTDGEDEGEEDEEDTAAGEPSRDVRGAAGPLDKGGSWCDS
ncbi:PRKCA-binding protein isoform X2 [Orcinus orca]|uniref:PRKCA-binding protein isoform X2 n=1 Tax=Orcinus orca TaxID=9733 RepID=UPI00211276BC|nr:PRKCA-binding protein isoform X2 [Orcinus orca]XP_049550928.1 PRKCA-binding protein isoform X2 [Orcinus orca]XP_049550929.1 PRKCA-binding protein isoform X2 [Orcinus orca]